jgi:hypothetical protein
VHFSHFLPPLANFNVFFRDFPHHFIPPSLQTVDKHIFDTGVKKNFLWDLTQTWGGNGRISGIFATRINGNRTIRPKKYDSAWPDKKQRIMAAFLSFLFGQGRIV